MGSFTGSIATGFYEFDIESPSWTDLNGTGSLPGSIAPGGRCNALLADGDSGLLALMGGDNVAEQLAGGACFLAANSPFLGINVNHFYNGLLPRWAA